MLTKTGYRVPRKSVISYPFNQEGMDGIPTGRHWLEAALELEKEAPELAERMKKNYFTWHSHGDHAHVKGSFSYALITGGEAGVGSSSQKSVVKKSEVRRADLCRLAADLKCDKNRGATGHGKS